MTRLVTIVSMKELCVPERTQFMIPQQASMSASVANSIRNSVSHSNASTPRSSMGHGDTDFESYPNFSEALRQSLTIDTGAEMHEDYKHRMRHPVQNVTSLRRSHSQLRHLTVAGKSTIAVIDDLGENITAIEVDERTLSCEVVEFFCLIETFTKPDVKLTSKNVSDLSFSKNLLLDSFSALKTHIRILRATYFRLIEIQKSSKSLKNRQYISTDSLPLECCDNSDNSDLCSLPDTSMGQYNGYISSRSETLPPRLNLDGSNAQAQMYKSFKSKEAECKRLQRQIKQLNTQLRDTKADTDRITQLEIENSHLKKAFRDQKLRADRCEDEIKHLTTRLITKETKLEEINRELENSHDRLESLSNERLSDCSEKALLQSQLVQMQKAVTVAEQTIKTQQTEHEINLEEKMSLLNKVKKENANILLEKVNLEQKLSIAEHDSQKCQQLQIQLDGSEGKCHEKDDRIAILEDRLFHLESDKKLHVDRYESMKRQFDVIQKHNGDLSRVINERRSLFDKTKESLTSQVESGRSDILTSYRSTSHSSSHQDYSAQLNHRNHILRTSSPLSASSSPRFTGAQGNHTTPSIQEIRGLEDQLRNSMEEKSRLKLERDSMEGKTLERINELRQRLAESENQHRGLQNSVNLMKRSNTSTGIGSSLNDAQ